MLEARRHEAMMANEHIMVGSNSYLGSLLAIQNSIQEEIKCRFKAGNSCYCSVQTLLSSRFLSKNLKFKICKTRIFPTLLNGCETWSLTLREECKLRVNTWALH